MRGPAGGREFEWGDQQVVWNLSEGASWWWGIRVRGPAGGGEFE